jgi:uncharacterized SAM-binding protein YcdF (DUF218 family)
MKWVGLGVLITVLLLVIGLPYYLGPNDLAGCDAKPESSSSEIKAKCKPADAIVAVSGGDTAARAGEAIKLYKNGWAPLLIFSGAAQDKSGPSNASVMRSQAEASGVPAKDILIEENSNTTAQNASETKNIFTENQINRVILVTSAYHQRRASLEFNKRSGNQIQIVNHPVAHDKQWSGAWWLTPIGWWLSLGELVKIISFYSGMS